MNRFFNNYRWSGLLKLVSFLLLSVFIGIGCGSSSDDGGPLTDSGTEATTGPYFEDVSLYTENFEGMNWIYQFGCIVYDDNYDIQSVIARSVTTGDEFILSDEITITGDWKWKTIGITGTPWLDQLEIIATNTNGDSSSVRTHILDNEQMLDYANNIVISDNSLTPRISWDSVSDAETYRIRIYNSGDERIFDSRLLSEDFTNTFYDVPAGVLSNGEVYSVRVIANDIEMESGNLELENRSSSYASFETAP